MFYNRCVVVKKLKKNDYPSCSHWMNHSFTHDQLRNQVLSRKILSFNRLDCKKQAKQKKNYNRNKIEYHNLMVANVHFEVAFSRSLYSVCAVTSPSVSHWRGKRSQS